MNELLIVKFGGSVITDKDSIDPKPNQSIITNLSEQLSDIYKTKTKRIILVHGAGCYAHPIAKKFDLKLGVFSAEQKLAAAEINYNMDRLSALVRESLVSFGVPAVGIPPHAFISQEGGQLSDIPVDIINKYLDLEMVPVLFGDMVLDSEINGSVISGDAIVPYLGKQLGAKSVIYVSDVNGIFSENPKTNPDSRHIKDINDDNYEEVKTFLTPNNNSDVTGEMAGKLDELKKYLTKIPIYITNGNIPNSLRETANGNTSGTTILFNG